MTMDIATLGIRVDATEARLAAVELDRLGAAGGRTATAMTNAERAAATMGVRMSSLNSVVGAFGVTLGLVGVVSFAKNSIMLADKMTLLDSRIKIATSSTSDYKSANEALTKISIATGSSLESNIIMFGRLNKSVESAGGSYRTTLDMVKTLNQGLKISGASTGEAKSVMVQLSQALSSGVLRGDEFNSVMENGSRIVDALTKATGKTKGELRDMAHEGKLTSAVVINALHSQAEAIASDFKKIPLTIGAALENISTSWSRYTQDVNSATGTTGAFAESLNAISTNLTPIIESILALGKIAATVFVAQMAGSIATYITAKQAAIAIESAHTAAISQNLQVNIARAEATLASTAAQANAGIATQASLVAERALVVERLQQITTSIAQTQATIAATSATIQSTSVLYLNRQATQALAISEQERAVIITELAVLGRQQAAVSAQVAIAQEAQAAATAGLSIAQDAAIASSVGLAASFKLLLNPLNLLNVGFAALIGWEFGTWLRSFETVRNGATAAIGAIATALENVTYGWDRLMLTISRASESDVNNLSAKHVAALSAINTNIMSGIETGLESAKVTATQDQALKALVDTQNKDEAAKKAAEKAAKEAAKAQDDITKGSLKEIDSLSDKHKKMTLSERDYYAQSDAIKNMTPAQKAWAMAQWDVNNAQEVQNKGIDYAKSKLSELKDKYEVLTLSARDYLAATMLANKVPEAEQKKVLTQFDKNTGAAAEKEKANALKKSHEDATNALQKYNDTIDSTGQKTQDLSSINSAIFDGALGGINTLVGALGTMSDALGNNSKEMERLNAEKDKISKYQPDMDKDNYIKDLKLKTDAAKKNNKEISDLEKKSLNDALNGTRQTAAAAAKMFGEKTVAAKAFHAIENGIAVAQMAMKVKDMAISSMATVKSFIAGAAKMFEQSGWLGFAGVAAMTALMAGLGFSMSGGSGGASEPPKSNDGTGTVLGDSSAKSDSLTRTNELLKNIHASEYVELRGINSGVNNLSKSILETVTKVFQGGGLSQVTLSPETLGGLGAIWDKVTFAFTGLDPIAKFVGNFLFGGKKTQSVVGQGIETWGTPLNGVIEGGNVQAGQYADIKTHTSGGLLTKSKDSYATGYQAVGGDIQKALNDVFKNVGTNLMVVAKSLGNNLTDTVKKAIIPAMRVDLMGLSGEDAAKKLNNVIGATMDTMSATIFGKIVGQYQQLGEGMFETAVRIVAEVEIVKDAFAQSGKAMPKLSINAISMADALVQAAGGLEEFQKRFEGFIDKFTTDPEKQTRTRKYLQGAFRENNLFDGKQIGSMLNSRDAYGNKVDAAAADVAKYAGDKSKTGMAKEKRAVERYSLLLEMAPKVDEFISYNEKVTKDTLDMDIKLAQSRGDGLEVSRLVLKSHEAELKLLPEKLRITQQLIWNQETANKQASLDLTLMKAQGRTVEALAISRQKELDAMEPSLQATQIAINYQEDLNKWQALDIKLMEVQGLSYEALTVKRNKELEGMDVTSQWYQRQINAQEDLNKQQSLSVKLMELSGNKAGALAIQRKKELDALDPTSQAIQRQIYAMEDLNTAMDKATSDVTSAMSRLTELSGKLKSTLSSTAIETNASLKADRANALALLKSTLIIAKMGGAIDNIAGMDKALADVAKPSEQLYSTFTDYARDQAITSSTISDLAGYADAQVSMAEKQLKAMQDTTTEVKGLPQALADLMGLVAQKKAITPQFASGGYHSGGWRVVGENGPELEHTGASRIFSNPQSKGLLSTDELVAELQALRAEVRAGQEAIANNTRQTAKILRDVTQDGQSITTSVVVV